MSESLMAERELIVSLIKKGYQNKQIQQIVGGKYSRIRSIRESIPNEDFTGQGKKYCIVMPDEFWDEWEIAVCRIFGGKKCVHLNP